MVIPASDQEVPMTMESDDFEVLAARALLVQPGALPGELDVALDRARDFAKAEKAPNTRRAYTADFAAFRAWCAGRGVSALPATAEIVAAFIGADADRCVKASTIGRRLAAIRYAHRLAGLPSPTEVEAVRAVIRGIRRTIGTAKAPKAPATNDRLLVMLASQKMESHRAKWVVESQGRDGANGASLASLRDKSLLLLGFAGAFRRSELVALNVSDIEEMKGGLRVTIRSGKTDQERAGNTIAIVRGSVACPVEALKAWLNSSGIREGAIFRRVNKADRLGDRLTAQSVALIVKAYAKRAGLDPRLFSGHSLRAGFLTSAAQHGASIFKMMDVSRHRSVDTLRGYVRDAELFRDHAGAALL
jgi:site-specific recombinase XerD